MNAQMEVYMENPGCVCVYNWVEWLRENVHPTPLDVSSAHEVKEEPKEEAEEVVEKKEVVPLPEKEFRDGATSCPFVKPAHCVCFEGSCHG